MENSGRFLLAIVLMIAVIVVTNLLFPPVAPEEPPVDRVEEPPVAVEPPEEEPPEVVPPAPPVPEPEPEPVEPPEPVVEPARLVPLETPLLRLALSSGGGALVSAELLRFESFTRPGPVELVPTDVTDLLAHRVQIGTDTVDLRTVPFEVEPADGLVLRDGDPPATLRFRGVDPRTRVGIELAYTLVPDRYMMRVDGQIRAPGAVVPRLLLDVGPTLRINEADPREDHRMLAYVVNQRREGISSVRLDAVRAERIEEGPLVWFGLKNKYFLVAALSPGDVLGQVFDGVIARPAPGEHTADLMAALTTARDGTFSYELFLGPQEYDQLVAAGRSLQDVNPYGWRLFRPIIQPLAHVVTWALVGLQRLLDIGYGWVLILFGVLLRVVMWPLNAKAMRAQLKNMAVQPKLQEIQKKYKEDPQRLQKEMMRLYKEEGFNPLGGCLPMLIPFPILITLFFVFQATIEFRGVEFLWLPDLARPDPYYILPLILGGSMFLIQWIGLRAMPTPNPQMKMLMWIMPIIMVVIFVNLASGLNLYYAAFNVATLPQQLQLSKERQRAQMRLASAEAAK